MTIAEKYAKNFSQVIWSETTIEEATKVLITSVAERGIEEACEAIDEMDDCTTYRDEIITNRWWEEEA